MQIDKVREERQIKGIELWENNNYRGILDYAPGVGKTHCAFLAIRRLDKIQRTSYLIIVPSEVIQKQWQAKISTLPKHLMERIVVKTVDTVVSQEIRYEVGLVILDEIHEYATPERIKLFEGTIIKTNKILGLTGSSDNQSFKYILNYVPIVDIISIQEARDAGFISDYIEYNLALSLTPNELKQYESYSEKINTFLPRFNNDLSKVNLVLFGGKDSRGLFYSGLKWAMSIAQKNGYHPKLNPNLPNHKKIIEIWNPNTIINYARVLNNSIKARQQLLYNATAKYNATVEIVKKFKNVKTIIFSESTSFSDKIAVILNARNHPTVVFHSKLKTIMATSKTGKLIKKGKTRLKNEAINAIKEGTAKAISTTRALDRGLDIPDIRLSIVTSGTQSTVQYKQRTGRATRKEEGISEPVLIVNLYIKDTQDERWLKNRTANLNHRVIWIDDVNDITYSPPENTFNLNISEI